MVTLSGVRGTTLSSIVCQFLWCKHSSRHQPAVTACGVGKRKGHGLSWINVSTSLHRTWIQDFWHHFLSLSYFSGSHVCGEAVCSELWNGRCVPGPVALHTSLQKTFSQSRAALANPIQTYVSCPWVFSIRLAPHLDVATFLPLFFPALLLFIRQLI